MTSLQCHQCGATFASCNKSASEPCDLNPPPGTRHYALLNSNDVPLESDSVFVKVAISKIDAPLASLDGEIARLRAQLQQLEEERASLSCHRDRNCAILSPLRRMPPEVLGQIFSWTLPLLRVTREKGVHITDSPWVLTHVSRRWRAIAFSIPSLWTFFAIRFRPHMNPSLAYPLPMVETQIARAQAQKLKIHFYGCETSNSTPQKQIFQCLTKHVSRWEELSFGLTSALFPLLKNLQGRFLSLLRLGIQWDSPKSQLGVESIDIFEMAPALVNVGVRSEHRSIPIRLPVQQLTRYSLDAPWETHRGILKLASNLVEARIFIDFDLQAWPDHGEIIQLPRLERLFVSHPETLAYLAFPALVALAIHTDASGEGLEHLEASLTRSSCPLRSLYFNGCPDSRTTFQILHKYPLIVDLGFIINDSDQSGAFKTLMTDLIVCGSEVAAPRLSSLFLGCFGINSYVDYEGYLEMVKSRWNSERCALKKAALLSESGPGPEGVTLSGLKRLREEGLELFLLDGPDAVEIMCGWLFYSRWV
ncbi:F-box domain-containing protein [Mycena venus]|uniref:F-box domain-containing protein n=1 Tax=Mycena venus TaxID=2733690 RepID=A0A8H6XSJ1_9AGAR|nr:F-box domain-containing protein [Mycena venus]